jgi:predicted small secreted protein
MRQNLTTTLALLALLVAAPLLSACNTTEGAGRDLSAAGRAMSNSAERHAP